MANCSELFYTREDRVAIRLKSIELGLASSQEAAIFHICTKRDKIVRTNLEQSSMAHKGAKDAKKNA